MKAAAAESIFWMLCFFLDNWMKRVIWSSLFVTMKVCYSINLLMTTFKLNFYEDFGKNYFEKVVKKTTWNDILDKKTCKTVTRKLSGRVISVKLKTYFVLEETCSKDVKPLRKFLGNEKYHTYFLLTKKETILTSSYKVHEQIMLGYLKQNRNPKDRRNRKNTKNDRCCEKVRKK